jgi:acetate kinase
MQQILVINSGSSSIKYELFDVGAGVVLESGLLERIGEEESRLTRTTGDTPPESVSRSVAVADHAQGIELISNAVSQNEAFRGGEFLVGIGHRVVHGGEEFAGPTLIDPSVVESIRELSALAPLHNPANLVGIEVARTTFPGVPQVAVFDTAFHQTLPPHAYRYAIPQVYYDEFRVRRYGFHGTSHDYVSKQVAKHLGQPLESLSLIVFHLGNGASAAAIRGGKCIDTSMGMTPLEGLMMGTRSGDLDPAILVHLGTAAGLSMEELDVLLNKESGLLGVCGESDMREVLRLASRGDRSAGLAVEMFCYRIKKYLGAYTAILGKLDAVALTAGIGENAAEIRLRSLSGLTHLGISIDPERNIARSSGVRQIQTDESPVKVLVVPTDESLEIAMQTLSIVESLR